MHDATVQTSALNLPHKRTRAHYLRLVVVAVVLGAVLYQPLGASLAVARTAFHTRHVMTRVREADRPADLPGLESELRSLAGELATLQASLDRMSPVLDRLEFVPWIGSTLAAADELADAAARATALAAEGLRLAAPATTPWNPVALAAVGSQISDLEADLAQLDEVVSELATRPLPRAVAERTQQAQAVVRLAQAAVQLGPMWGQLLGVERPVTYLILVQNNHELRATGGFISAVGAATLVNAALTDLVFVDSYAIYQEGLAYPPAPAPMVELMGVELLLLRDATGRAGGRHLGDPGAAHRGHLSGPQGTPTGQERTFQTTHLAVHGGLARRGVH